VEAVLLVFTSDALQSSHPVSVTIHNPNEIGEMFDAISYQKGEASRLYDRLCTFTNT
jgi:aminopeptidase N